MFRIYKSSFLGTVLSMLGVLALVFGGMWQFGGTGITGIVLIVAGVALMIAGLVVSLIKARKAANQPEQSESLLGPDPRDLKPDHVRAMDFAVTLKEASNMDQSRK